MSNFVCFCLKKAGLNKCLDLSIKTEVKNFKCLAIFWKGQRKGFIAAKQWNPARYQAINESDNSAIITRCCGYIQQGVICIKKLFVNDVN